MTKKCFYCGDVLTEVDFLLDKAVTIMPQTYAHIECVGVLGDGSIVVKKCHYCWRTLSDGMFADGRAIKIGRDRYAHVDCIDSHGKDETMNEQAQHILGAADSAHQGIDLAISLLQESLANMGEILTAGCARLGLASLGMTMRLGQKLKEHCFLLSDLLKDAHGLCVLLGKDLGACEDKAKILDARPGLPSERTDYHETILGDNAPDSLEQGLSHGDGFSPADVLDSEDLDPGEDEFDDDEYPF